MKKMLFGTALWALMISNLVTAQAPTEPQKAKDLAPIAYFTDDAEKAGLTMMNVFGGSGIKKYIIETTGTGVAVFDYDNDGWPDIFIVNGTTLQGFPAGNGPTSHLYHNNRSEERRAGKESKT